MLMEKVDTIMSWVRMLRNINLSIILENCSNLNGQRACEIERKIRRK